MTYVSKLNEMPDSNLKERNDRRRWNEQKQYFTFTSPLIALSGGFGYEDGSATVSGRRETYFPCRWPECERGDGD